MNGGLGPQGSLRFACLGDKYLGMILSPRQLWVLIDKPIGPTSMWVTSQVRRHFSAVKAGHAGTLDPMASGLLPVALDESTKVIPWLMDADKSYVFTVRFGVQTVTDDAEGREIAWAEGRPSDGAIAAVIPQFLGVISQAPPAYSAIKVGGERSYALARKGQSVELAPRDVTIHELELLDRIDADHVRFSVRCSKGTYVRRLARDLAQALGTLGHLTTLRRTRVGNFDVAHAISLDYLKNVGHIPPRSKGLLSIRDVLADIPAIFVDADDVQQLRRGCPIKNRWINVLTQHESSNVWLCCSNEDAVAMVRVDDTLLRPFRVFNI